MQKHLLIGVAQTKRTVQSGNESKLLGSSATTWKSWDSGNSKPSQFAVYQAFKQVKTLFDPDNLMNPGKIVDSPDIRENLRYGSQYQDSSLETEFKYKVDGGFHAAVHMCTGVGECRKTRGGTMCPSFKATREEEHSTRGRANALRLAMSNQLGDQGLDSH